MVHAVQDVIYPARELPDWPDEERRSRLVFICRGMPPSTMAGIRQSLVETVCPALGRPGGASVRE